MKNLPKHIRILIYVLASLIVLSGFNTLYNNCINLYNQTKVLQLSYDKINQEQVSNYDGYYLAFNDKRINANINKEAFIEVTNIIMTNRKDGQNIAWKWMQENQQIPYNEFTSFYKELSSFISERYQDNMLIEKNKQTIVKDHNLLISTYPNLLFNLILDINPLVYKAGYISNETKSKFK